MIHDDVNRILREESDSPGEKTYVHMCSDDAPFYRFIDACVLSTRRSEKREGEEREKS